ncbi:MAG TPA: hypothetical protein VH108_04635 [Gaiellaceae bacterium]|jgi:hypothetical protein|nr:hypothetical protein [Gaiellaceae bacterium]
MIRKLVPMLAAAAAVSLVAASAATADPPTRTFVPFPGALTGEFCPGVQVQITALLNNEYAIAFTNGSVITTGQLVAQVKNLSTGKSVVVNASGPGKLDADGTFTLRGETLVFLTPGTIAPGSPATTYILSGVLSFAPDGTVTQTGHITDICSQIT